MLVFFLRFVHSIYGCDKLFFFYSGLYAEYLSKKKKMDEDERMAELMRVTTYYSAFINEALNRVCPQESGSEENND